MAKVVTITNPVTGQPAQVDQLDHTAQQIDDAVEAARWSHRNLLDNAYFANPDAIIDQRGGYVVPPDTPYYSDTGLSTQVGTVSAYTTAKPGNGTYGTITVSGTTYYVKWSAAVRGYVGAGYTIDRFLKEASGAIIIENDGITVDASNGTTVFIQKASADFITCLLSKTVTLTVLLEDNTLLTATDTLPDTIPTSTTVYLCQSKSSGIEVEIALFGAAKSYQLIRCVVSGGNTKKLKAAKLELGTVQTLAHQDENGNWVLNDPPPDKGMELLRCIQSTADSGDGYANKVILHTGNKPSGRYTGNGSVTSRTIDTGGMGHVIMIFGSNGSALIVDSAGYSCSGGAVENVLYSSAHFNNGILYLATDHTALNANGVTYNYQVL